MKPKITLYTRRDCCLCDDMKAVIKTIGAKFSFDLEEIDVDSAVYLREQFGSEVPVLFIDGRKAFKYRLTAGQLEKKLRGKSRPLWPRWARAIGKEGA